MVTKPTGRPRGRPKKAKPVEQKKTIGAPPKPFPNDEERYLLAFVQHHFDQGKLHGVSERRIADLYAGLLCGNPINDQAAIDAYAGRGFHVKFVEGRQPPLGAVANYKEPGKVWHEQTKFRPYADSIRRKLLRIRKRPEDHPDRIWLTAMVLSWRECCQGNLQNVAKAERLAAHVNELAYFKLVMLPVMHRCFARKLSPETIRPITAPELLAYFVPHT